MNAKLVLGVSTLALVLAGCTTKLVVTPEPGFPSSDPLPAPTPAPTPAPSALSSSDDGPAPYAPVEGVPYTLPATKLEIEVTWTLTNCPYFIATPVQDASGNWVLETIDHKGRYLELVQRDKTKPPVLKAFETKGTGATPTSADDFSEYEIGDTTFSITAKEAKITQVQGPRFTIKNEALDNAFKTGQLKVEYYKSGFIKSIGATAKGQEGEILASTVGLTASVARLAMGLPIPSPDTGASSLQSLTDASNEAKKVNARNSPCSPAGVAIFREKKELGESIKRLQAGTIKNLEGQLSQAKLALAGGGDAETIKKQIAALIMRISAAQSVVDEKKERLAELDKKLAVSQTFTLPGTPKGSGGEPVYTYEDGPEPKKYKALTAVALNDKIKDEVDTSRADQASYGTVLQESLVVKFELTPLSDGDPARLTTLTSPTTEYEGLIFRQPALGKLNVKRKMGDTLISTREMPIAQFGRLRIISLNNAWGEETELSANFEEDGTLTMVELKKTESGVANALKGFDGAVGTLIALEQQKKADEIAKEEKKEKDAKDAAQAVIDADKARLEDLERQLEILKAEDALSDFDSSPPATAALEAELEVLRLQEEASSLLKSIRENEKVQEEQ